MQQKIHAPVRLSAVLPVWQTVWVCLQAHLFRLALFGQD